MKNLIFLVARLVCLASLATSVLARNRVIVGYDDNYVSTEETSPYGDTDVRTLGRRERDLTSYNNDTAWTNALAESKVLIFPEGTDGRDISSDTRQAIINWVSEGGVVVFCMGETTLARILTALELRPLEAKRALSGVWAKSEAGAASSLFSSGPAQVMDLDAASSWDLSADVNNEVAGLECMYGTVDDCAVWQYEQGSGKWFGLAPDFWFFGGSCGQDGGWRSVLKSVVASNGIALYSSAAQLTSWVNWFVL